jgi:hypothetical protein
VQNYPLHQPVPVFCPRKRLLLAHRYAASASSRGVADEQNDWYRPTKAAVVTLARRRPSAKFACVENVEPASTCDARSHS